MTNADFMPIERYYALKSTFERVWGKDTYSDLKHCTELPVWRSYCEKTLRLTQIAATDTVSVADDGWHFALSEIIESGLSSLKGASSFDDLFQSLSATYIEISFHQLGFMPSANPSKRSKMKRGSWKLDAFRSVQYVQTREQKIRHEEREARHVKARQALVEREGNVDNTRKVQAIEVKVAMK